MDGRKTSLADSANPSLLSRDRARDAESLGEPQTIGPGDCWLMEDTTGDGHETSVISEGPFEALVVQIP